MWLTFSDVCATANTQRQFCSQGRGRCHRRSVSAPQTGRVFGRQESGSCCRRVCRSRSGSKCCSVLKNVAVITAHLILPCCHHRKRPLRNEPRRQSQHRPRVAPTEAASEAVRSPLRSRCFTRPKSHKRWHVCTQASHPSLSRATGRIPPPSCRPTSSLLAPTKMPATSSPTVQARVCTQPPVAHHPSYSAATGVRWSPSPRKQLVRTVD